MTDGTFVQELGNALRAQRAATLTLADRTWLIDGDGRHHEVLPRLAQPLGFVSLSGIAQFAEKEGDLSEDFFQVGPGVIQFYGPVDSHGQRPLKAQAATPLSSMIGDIMKDGYGGSLANTIRGLLSECEDTPERAALLKTLGNVREESIRTHADDGVSASVTVTSGLARAAEATIGPITTLRTKWVLFTDVRARHPEGVDIRVALRLHPAGQGRSPYADDGPSVELSLADPGIESRLMDINHEELLGLTSFPILR